MITTAANKIAALKKPVRVVQGGQGAGKTYSIVQIIDNHCYLEPNELVTIIGATMPKLKRGAIRDFKKIAYDNGHWQDIQWNMTEQRAEYPNGSVVEFVSGDRPDKFRGARRTGLFINEAESVAFELYNHTSARTSGVTYIDYNPSHEFWVHSEVIPQDSADFLILTYRDNEAIPEAERNYILQAKEKAKTSQYWANWYKVYGEGELGALEGVVFKEFMVVDEFPEDVKLQCYGLDFGFTNDPAALVKMGYYDGGLYWDEQLYHTGLTNPDLAERFKVKGLVSSDEIYADSAEPKSIEELNRLGFTVLPATKGPDSIRYGISVVQQQPLYVTKSSVNLIKELRNYVWMEKDGAKLNKPVDKWNHGIDAGRYAAMMKLGAPQTQWHERL